MNKRVERGLILLGLADLFSLQASMVRRSMFPINLVGKVDSSLMRWDWIGVEIQIVSKCA